MDIYSNIALSQSAIKGLLDVRINFLKKLQKEHNLFLDLEEDKVRKKYRRTYPRGTTAANFFYMICGMTKEYNLNNEIVVKEIQKSIEFNKVAKNKMFLLNQFHKYMCIINFIRAEHGIYLDLKDEDIEKKYNETYPVGTNIDNFIRMIINMTSGKDIDMVKSSMNDSHMSELKKYRKEHKLFLDLEDEDVKKKYYDTYPEGADSLDFLLMICSMTKDKDILKNKVIKRQMVSLKKEHL